MERPSIVWVYTIFVILGALFTIFSSLRIITNPYGNVGLPSDEYYAAYISLFLVIPQILFIYFFFMLKRSSLIWLYISVGVGVVLNLIAQQWIWAVVMAVFAWVVWDYISHKKVNEQPVFT